MTALDTGTEDLRAEIEDGVAVITMNRPDRRNAFSQAMMSAMAEERRHIPAFGLGKRRRYLWRRFQRQVRVPAKPRI